MSHQWDEFSKSLAEEPVPRRETLRRLGAVFTGAALMPFSLALGAPKRAAPDPCKAFCNRCPKQQRSQCLAACQACNGNTSRLCGTCGNYTSCASGLACCSGACVDIFEDYDNCGGCGHACEELGPYEDGACVDGTCLYNCVDGALFCDGACIPVLWDPNNCGGCGNVCAGPDPYCNEGVCSECYPGQTNCGGSCVDLVSDTLNCGACGNACPAAAPFCSNGICLDRYCGGADLNWDNQNCGWCGNVCPQQFSCVFGTCEGSGGF